MLRRRIVKGVEDNWGFSVRMEDRNEAPGAYQDVDTVISRQLDLVEIVHTLWPLITVKGSSKARDD